MKKTSCAISATLKIQVSEWSIFNKKNLSGGWVGGLFLQEILPLRGSILQAGPCKILSLAENPRWSRVWQ